ncbi:hypothetical protein [Spongiimicrobium sp. 3-5]|uniref:hypothetical protein n=1 Tax=Spongiimicrobium sp. 3-5 TaxID=3332596 RepID=UPI00397FBBDC
MLIWSGRGFLVVVVLVGLIVISEYLLPKQYSDYGFIIAFFGTAVFSWYFGIRWNNKNARAVIDKETGKEFLLKNNHSLFWIKMQYWAIVFGFLGTITALQIVSESV